MKEQLISFEVAKLAKELGYNGRCYEMFYSKDGKNYKTHKQSAEHYQYVNCSKFFGGADVHDYERSTVKLKDILKRPSDYPAKKFLYSRTSQSLLQKWLREEQNVHIAILPKMLPDEKGTVKYYIFKGQLKRNWTGLYNTYEEALEVALLELLKNLKEKK